MSSLEDEVAAAEALATGPILSRLKTHYDAELRRRHPSHLVKFRYASVLCCSASRSLTRRGIDMLEELSCLMRSEAQLLKERAPPLPIAAPESPRERSSPSPGRARGLSAEEDSGFVLLRGGASPEPSSPLPASTTPGQVSDYDDADDAGNFSSDDEESELEPDAGEPHAHTTPDMNQSDRLLLAGLDVTEPRVPAQCLYFRALAFYRLGEYAAALTALEAFCAEASGPAERAQGQRLRKACVFARVSRGALGVLVTIGVVLPAVLWHRSGGLIAGGGGGASA